MNERVDVLITGYGAAAAGATTIGVNGPILFGGWHLLGTDPERSVVNEWGRCHDLKNLFIVDGSIFVTSGGVNPTSTFQAAGALDRRQHHAAPGHPVRLRPT
jgi:hypothetical protein